MKELLLLVVAGVVLYLIFFAGGASTTMQSAPTPFDLPQTSYRFLHWDNNNDCYYLKPIPVTPNPPFCPFGCNTGQKVNCKQINLPVIMKGYLK